MCARYMHVSTCRAELFSRSSFLFIYFFLCCKNAGASDGEWARSLIHLCGKHSFLLPPPPIIISAGSLSLLSIHLLHGSFILGACTVARSPSSCAHVQHTGPPPDTSFTRVYRHHTRVKNEENNAPV